MAKSTKKQSIWILTTIIAAIIGAAAWFWIWPSWQAISASINDIQQKKADIEQLKQRQQINPQADFASYENDLKKMQTTVVTEDNLIEVVETLENVAGEVGVEYELSVSGEESTGIGTIAANNSPDQKDPAKKDEEASNQVDLTLKLKGSFPQLIEVLKKIENLPVVVSITIPVIEKSIQTSGEELEIVSTTITGTYSLTIPLAK